MDYKGYNIAVHELGHNVEQTFSLNEVPYNALEGVPNTAFTEALAFVFQARDLELLGLAKPDATSEALAVLDDFWGAFEIGGVALVDMRVWRWMYAHPEATPAELREATLDDRARGLEPFLCAGLRPPRRGAARHLLAHDQFDAVPARLSGRRDDRAAG